MVKISFASKSFLLLFFLFAMLFNSQQLVSHSTNYFGPNANPVPDFTDATIPEFTELSVYGDYYFGKGDQTVNPYLKVEIPLISEKVSLKVWAVPIEYFNVADAIKERRGMQKNSGFASGDVYVQTRISLLKNKEKETSLILNATLKTASGNNYKDRRFFNTAGYYFDAEFGKSFMLKNGFLNEVRLVADAGFYSWDIQTPNLNVQDDALMYGLKLILKKNNITWENTISGYSGWVKRVADYGDQPVIFASKLNLKNNKNTYFIQYQNGIRYFPFNQIRIGVVFPLESLTPNFFR